MKIFISPAKKMIAHIAYAEAQTTPVFLKQSKELSAYMKDIDIAQLQQMLKCSQSIAQWTKKTYQNMDLNVQGVPAILAYDGIQYHYMKPDLFDVSQFAYVKEHLCILSGLYGVLRAFDGVVPYRLEMDSSFCFAGYQSLYAYWGDQLYRYLIKQDKHLLNLASRQYAKAILPFCEEGVSIVTCYFYEEEAGSLREKGVYVKMARGEMVRYLAVNNITEFAGVKNFQAMGYRFHDELSTQDAYVFVRKAIQHPSVANRGR